MAKYEYKISFKECEEKGNIKRNDLIRIDKLQGTALLSLFRNYKDDTIGMDNFVTILNNSGFKVTKAIYNESNNEYIIESPSGDIALYLSMSKTEFFKNKDKKAYKATIDTLKGMYTDDTIKVGNNTTPLFNTDNNLPYSGKYKANLKEIAGGKKNVKVYMQTIRKFFKDKPKVAIALCTLAVGFSIVAGSFIAHSVAIRAEAQEVINNNLQYSYQNDQSSDTINKQSKVYQAIQNGEVDDSLANPNANLEEMKMDYNEENYQNVR